MLILFSGFRHAKRYQSSPSPITAVEWWRIVCDESQVSSEWFFKTLLNP
jgi:hypothetical protein